MLAISCTDPVSVDEVVVSTCDFDSSITVETETPLPVYSISLHYDECGESIALFRENLNYTGADLPIRLGTDLQTVTPTFVNSVAEVSAQDQEFTISILDGERFVLVGTGVVRNGMAYIQSYAPAESQFYYRNL